MFKVTNGLPQAYWLDQALVPRKNPYWQEPAQAVPPEVTVISTAAAQPVSPAVAHSCQLQNQPALSGASNCSLVRVLLTSDANQLEQMLHLVHNLVCFERRLEVNYISLGVAADNELLAQLRAEFAQLMHPDAASLAGSGSASTADLTANAPCDSAAFASSAASPYYLVFNHYRAEDYRQFSQLAGLDSKQQAQCLRLLATDIWQSGRLIYLDIDMVVTAPLAPLCDFDLGGASLAACHDYAPGFSNSAFVWPLLSSRYFNSGLLVLDLDNYHTKHAKSWMEYFSDFGAEWFNFIDQDLLNLVHHQDVFWLHPNFNHQALNISQFVAMPYVKDFPSIRTKAMTDARQAHAQVGFANLVELFACFNNIGSFGSITPSQNQTKPTDAKVLLKPGTLATQPWLNWGANVPESDINDKTRAKLTREYQHLLALGKVELGNRVTAPTKAQADQSTLQQTQQTTQQPTQQPVQQTVSISQVPSDYFPAWRCWPSVIHYIGPDKPWKSQPSEGLFASCLALAQAHFAFEQWLEDELARQAPEWFSQPLDNIFTWLSRLSEAFYWSKSSQVEQPGKQELFAQLEQLEADFAKRLGQPQLAGLKAHLEQAAKLFSQASKPELNNPVANLWHFFSHWQVLRRLPVRQIQFVLRYACELGKVSTLFYPPLTSAHSQYTAVGAICLQRPADTAALQAQQAGCLGLAIAKATAEKLSLGAWVPAQAASFRLQIPLIHALVLVQDLETTVSPELVLQCGQIAQTQEVVKQLTQQRELVRQRWHRQSQNISLNAAVHVQRLQPWLAAGLLKLIAGPDATLVSEARVSEDRVSKAKVGKAKVEKQNCSASDLTTEINRSLAALQGTNSVPDYENQLVQVGISSLLARVLILLDHPVVKLAYDKLFAACQVYGSDSSSLPTSQTVTEPAGTMPTGQPKPPASRVSMLTYLHPLDYSAELVVHLLRGDYLNAALPVGDYSEPGYYYLAANHLQLLLPQLQ